MEARGKFALIDASVLYAGILGTGESALLLATIRLGGLDAFTPETPWRRPAGTFWRTSTETD